MSSEDIVIDVRHLSKRYEIYNTPRDRLKQLILPRLQRAINRIGDALGVQHSNRRSKYFREFWALKDISFQVRRGETVGIIGRNGSGKSTLLQILAGTLMCTAGEAEVSGRIAALLELGSGFNPEFSGRDNVFLNGRILGLTQKEIEARYDQIVEFADIGDFIDQPVKTYSSGMFVRLAFAVQAHIDASIVIIDEALAVGDVFFTQKCFSRLRELVDSGAAVILVTHDMATVTQFCSRVLVLDSGEELYHGEPISAIRRYMALQRGLAATIKKRALSATELLETSIEAIEPDGWKWPDPDVFFDINGADVVGNNQAEFRGVALCDADGEPSRLFQMGQSAYFFVEYYLLEDIDMPIGGVTIINDKGILVHGKNSLQHGMVAPKCCQKGTTLRFKQRIVLDVAPGEYTFVVGLAAIDHDAGRNSGHMTHDDLSNLTTRVLSVGRAGAFTVSFRAEGLALTHHGIANLPGECELFIIDINDRRVVNASA